MKREDLLSELSGLMPGVVDKLTPRKKRPHIGEDRIDPTCVFCRSTSSFDRREASTTSTQAILFPRRRW